MSEVIPIVVGIDGGSTKTAVRVSSVSATDDPWSVHTVWDKSGTNLHGYNDWLEASSAGPRELDQAIDQALTLAAQERQVPKEALHITSVVIGTAGLDSPNDQQNFLAVFCTCLHLRDLPAGRLRVCSDVVIINRYSTANARLCLIAGTGSNCYAWRMMNDNWTLQCQVGGLDLPLSDQGSAAWIGLKACQRALFLANTNFGGNDFAAAVYGHLGVNLRLLDPANMEKWRQIKQKVADMSKRELAEISEKVVASMANAGNQEALAILHQAGNELADMAAGAITYLDAAARADEAFFGTEDAVFDLLLVGGVWKSDLVFQAFMEGLASREIHNAQLPNDKNFTNRVVDPTIGAIAMARSLLK